MNHNLKVLLLKTVILEKIIPAGGFEGFMKKPIIKRNTIFVVLFFFFLIFHHFNTFLIGPLVDQVLSDIGSESFWRDSLMIISFLVAAGALLLWGLLFDRHTRKKLLSVAAFLWGTSSLLIGISPTYATFFFSYVAGNMDRTSHAGIYALAGDFFGPKKRGRVLGLFLFSQPIALLLVLLITEAFEEWINLRSVVILLGLIGFVFSLLIAILIREPKRGTSEPALAGIQLTGVYTLDWEIGKKALSKSTLLFIYALSFLMIIPSSVIFVWMAEYLNQLPGVSESVLLWIFLATLIMLAAGHYLGGLLGDILFKVKKTGRVMTGMAGTVLSILLFSSVMHVTDVQSLWMIILMALMGLFISFAWPNIFATVLDITVPEVRGTALSIIILGQLVGLVLSVNLVISLQNFFELGQTILWVSLAAWLLCLPILVKLLQTVPREIEELRRHMAYRSQLEARLGKDSNRG